MIIPHKPRLAAIGGDERAVRRQGQRAGQGAQQLQVAGDVHVVQGLSVDEAMTIAMTVAGSLRDSFVAEGLALAEERVQHMAEKTVRELLDSDHLSAFADPAFQLLYRRAQLTAAATANEEDHDLIAKLLGERAKSDTPRMRLAVQRAIEIIDQLDDDGVRLLVILWVLGHTSNNSGDLEKSLEGTQSFLATVLGTRGLPPFRPGLLDDLEILRCVTLTRAPGLVVARNHRDRTLHNHPAFASGGISGDDVAGFEARLAALRIGGLIVPHKLIPDRFRLYGQSVDHMIELTRKSGPDLSESQERELRNLAADAGMESRDEAAVAAFDDYYRKFELLAAADDLRMKYAAVAVPEVTSVGKVIAYSDARRWDPMAGIPTLAHLLNDPS